MAAVKRGPGGTVLRNASNKVSRGCGVEDECGLPGTQPLTLTIESECTVINRTTNTVGTFAEFTTDAPGHDLPEATTLSNACCLVFWRRIANQYWAVGIYDDGAVYLTYGFTSGNFKTVDFAPQVITNWSELDELASTDLEDGTGDCDPGQLTTIYITS